MADNSRPKRAAGGDEPKTPRAKRAAGSNGTSGAAKRPASSTGKAGTAKAGAGKASQASAAASKPSRAKPSQAKAGKPGQPKATAASSSRKPGASSSKRAAKKPRSKARRILVNIVRTLLILFLSLTLVGTVGAYAFYQQTELPDPNADFLTQTSRLYFNDGVTELGELAVQNRTAIPYAEMPQSIKDAVVAAEDRSFWTNRGIDIKGMARAVWRIARGQDVQGGSTITQQYIKIAYLTSDQTLSRKFTELALAVKMNKAESKESVLEGYLNTIYFGRGAYGIQAAAETFFRVDAKDLTIGQSAMLASIINSPSYYDPAGDPEAEARLLERYNYVLDGMLDPMATITQAQHDEFYGRLPELPEYQINNIYGGPNGFLIQMATDELKAKGFSENEINGGGLSIITTFDARRQQAAIDAAQSVIAEAVANAAPLRDEFGQLILDEAGNTVQPDAAQLHVGLASIEVGTGAVLALYGGADYVANSRNWALTPRYAASTFKIWGAVAGLRNGFGLSSTFQGSTYTPPGDSVPVHNDSGAQYGPLTLLRAIQYSVNTSFVDMVSRIPNGTAELIKAANDAGIPEHSSWAQQGGRLVLGQGEVSALDNTTGYATLANNGVRNETHVVAEVRDANGNVIYTGNTVGVQAIEDAVARDVTYAMSGAVAGSTANAVGGRDVAGKTGTSGEGGQGEGRGQITQSAWLSGYTKQISTSVVMIAGEDGNQNLDVYARPGSGAFYGAGYPTDVWDRYMQVAVADMPYVSFDPPANIQPTVRDTLAPSTFTAEPTSIEPSSPEPTTEEPTTEAPPPTSTEPAPPTTTAPPPTSVAPPPTTNAPPPTTQPPPTEPSAPVTGQQAPSTTAAGVG